MESYRKSLRCAVVAAVILFLAPHIYSQALQHPVPFKLPSRDTTFSQYLPTGSDVPAGKHGALSLDTNGHIIAKDGTRLRFFGTELDYTSNFLSGTDAHTLALRLRKLGFNAVRLVNDDYYGWDDASIFRVYDSLGAVNYTSYKVNWTQFARLDTLLNEFKQAGIYTFLTLSSVHQFGTLDGIPGLDSINSYYYFFARFTSTRAAELEREWTRTLLTHVNPLSGIQYSQDPSIAAVEIAWQTSLQYYWSISRLNYTDTNNVAPKGNYTISYFQSRQLDTLFATFLRNKYHNDVALNAAWQGNPNPSQANLMDDGSFEQQGSPAWTFPAPLNGAQAVFVDADGGVDSSIYKKIKISSISAMPSFNDIYAMNTSPTTVCHKDSLYEVTFWAKMGYSASRPTELSRQIYLYVTNAGVPITIDTTWKEYRYSFRCSASGVQIIYVLMGNALGDVWLDAMSLHHKAEIGLMPGESMTNASVIRFSPSNIGMFPLQRVRDQTMFMDSLQSAYFLSIGKFIKDTLQFKGLVNYSQANYWTTTPDQYINSLGDVTEGIVGWDYLTTRAGKPYSDSTWYMVNGAEVQNTNAGNMGYYLPSNSVAGKAFIATMGVPSINQYSAEHMLLLPSYASLQDWDGIFFEMYATNRAEAFADTIFDYFTSASYHYYAMAANGAELALAPVASSMFRNGYVQAATFSQNILHDPDDVNLAPLNSFGPWGVEGYLDPNIITSFKVRQQFDATKHKVAAQYAYVGDTSVKKSITKELIWDQTDGDFTINTPKLNGAAGLFATDTVALSAIKFARLENTRDMFTLYYECEDSLSLDSSARSFLTISPRVQNSGLHWIDSAGFGVSWGTAPMLMNAQRVMVSIESAFDSVLIYPLDSMGRFMQIGDKKAEIAEIVGQKANDAPWFSATIDQSIYPSVWYYIVKKNATLAVASTEPTNFSIAISPNPASASATLRVSTPNEEHISVTVVDDLGREVQTVAKDETVLSRRDFAINTSTLAAGHYVVRITMPGHTEVRSLNVIR